MGLRTDKARDLDGLDQGHGGAGALFPRLGFGADGLGERQLEALAEFLIASAMDDLAILAQPCDRATDTSCIRESIWHERELELASLAV